MSYVASFTSSSTSFRFPINYYFSFLTTSSYHYHKFTFSSAFPLKSVSRPSNFLFISSFFSLNSTFSFSISSDSFSKTSIFSLISLSDFSRSSSILFRFPSSSFTLSSIAFWIFWMVSLIYSIAPLSLSFSSNRLIFSLLAKNKNNHTFFFLIFQSFFKFLKSAGFSLKRRKTLQ